MGRGSSCPGSSVALYGHFDRAAAPPSARDKTVLFTTSFESAVHEHTNLHAWMREQQQFDSPRDCWEILAELVRRGAAIWAEVRYDVVDAQRLKDEFAALPEPPED